MVATKERAGKNGGNGNGAGSSSGGDSIDQPECCMCGDYGISVLLFRCKICKFRSQHKYCCNEYPKDGLYKACNWCLASNSTNTTSTSKNIALKDLAAKNKKNPNHKTSQISLKERRKTSVTKTAPINKLMESSSTEKGVPVNKMMASSTPNESPSASTDRKKGVPVIKKVLRKSKSANCLSYNNGGGVQIDGIKTKPSVFRTRVKKYRSVEEVTSQCTR